VGYPGGKNGAGVYQRIINMMPPHEAYVEPFLGGGAVMRLKKPAVLNYGFDLSASAVEKFEAARIARNGDGAQLPVRILYRRVSAEVAMVDPIGTASPHWAIQPGCGLAFLESSPLMASGSTLVYCDPPYLRSTRSGGRLYEFEMTDVDHRRLLRWAIAARCRVMISGYWSGIYARSLRSWRCVKFQAMTRGGLADECLWMNFEEAAALHDYRYLGENFRARERIKRKTLRWRNRLAKMPLLERRALLCAIADNAEFGDAAGKRR
jgi:DNA adenine methylase